MLVFGSATETEPPPIITCPVKYGNSVEVMARNWV